MPSRRDALRIGTAAVLCGLARPAPAEPRPDTAFVVLGTTSTWLLRAPLSAAVPDALAIAEVAFDVTTASVLAGDRVSHPRRSYVFWAVDGAGPLQALGTAEPPARLEGVLRRDDARNVIVRNPALADVRAPVFHRRLQPGTAHPERLRCLLFGRGRDLFLVHLSTGTLPDYDQVLAVTAAEPVPDEASLAHGIEIVVPDRNDTVDQRLRARSEVTARAAARPVRLVLGDELWFLAASR